MTVNRENVIGITMNGNHPEAISLSLGDINNGQRGGRTSWISTQTIDKCGVGVWEETRRTCWSVVPRSTIVKKSSVRNEVNS